MARPLENAPEVEVRSRAELRAWLAQHHSQTTGVWLVSYKKAAGDLYLPTEDIVQECLCYGWVDSLVRRKDDLRAMLYIAPRKPGSNWSRVNRNLVARLEAEGLMTMAGRALIERAKADGTWTALDDVEDGIVPPDLAAALDAVPGARAAWDAYPRSVRRGALEIVLNAKRAETRAAKIGVIVDCARNGERPFQWRGPGPAAVIAPE